MTALNLAEQYLQCVYETGNWDQLREILADDLVFKGPWYDFMNADDYVNSLRVDPPIGFTCALIESYSNDNSACLIYHFSKPGVSTIMAQLFHTVNNRIKSINLVFDTAAFR